MTHYEFLSEQFKLAHTLATSFVDIIESTRKEFDDSDTARKTINAIEDFVTITELHINCLKKINNRMADDITNYRNSYN